jgi:hypothetical protein
MFCASELVFGGTKGVRSRFHVLRYRTGFRHPVSFSYFSLPHSFSTVPRASGPVFMFCASGLVFGGAEGVGYRFDVLHAWTLFRGNRWRRVPFSCFARPDSFLAIPGASGLVLNVLRSHTHFRRYQGRHISFSCFYFMFCAPGLIFGGAKCVGSRFQVLCARTRFRRYRGRRVSFSCFTLPNYFLAIPSVSGSRFHVLRARTRFRRYRERQILFA